MAVATVSGSAMTSFLAMAAAPSASKPYIFGRSVFFSSLYCLKPFQYALIFPALPTGIAKISGALPPS